MFEEPPKWRQGALPQPDGSVLWRIWAPLAERVDLVTWRDGRSDCQPMQPAGWGYHTFREGGLREGLRYAYRLEREGQDGEYPDPASCWQPEGVHRPSAVFFPDTFRWTDYAWRGVPREDLVIYELHVGTFTPEGTLDAIVPRLSELKALGVTALELMPLAQFPGRRNWGYDGVHPYAVQDSYGGPRALQRLVDAAHRQQLAVLLDVVYNHLGPEGNYLTQFGPYFTDRYRTPWGPAVNVDGAESVPVRRFLVENARMWIRDFHLDGLRLDAVHAIHDRGPRHILQELQAEVQIEAARQGRTVHVIAESDENDVRLIDQTQRGGFELDAVWSDDFHHSVRALLGGQRQGYYQDFGRPEQLAKAFREPFVFDGCYSSFRRRCYGTQAENRDRTRFVVFVHNHDQIGNRARGDRAADYLPPAAQRLAAGLLMLSPCVPLLFMGEEYGETRPFPFFCSFGDPQLVEAVRRGRCEEFADMGFGSGEGVLDPQDPSTFESAQLSWQWPAGTLHEQLRRLYADLLRARHQWPALRNRQDTAAWTAGDRDCQGAEQSPAILIIQRGSGCTLLACANLTPESQPLPELEIGERCLRMSSEEPRYGGERQIEATPLRLHPYELMIFTPGDWPR